MEYKKIKKPEINPNITKPDIVGWKFRKTPTPNRGKYCIRFTLNFADKSMKQCQVGGFATKEDAIYMQKDTKNNDLESLSKEFIKWAKTEKIVPVNLTTKYRKESHSNQLNLFVSLLTEGAVFKL